MAGPNPTSWTTSLPALEKTHRSTQGDGRVPQQTAYTERYRPQFHFTARRNWLNDPNGCVFYDGEYHLFFQHNPSGLDWGNMTWGHAVSTDLVHWRQLSHALLPYGDGTIFSGSAVVDSKNLSGLGHGQEGLLVAAFTHARKPFGQAIAFSHDRGRTWERYADGEHVVPNQGLDDGERDPKVLWHEPSRKWVMVLWVQRNRARFFTSSDLRQWRHASDVVAQGFYECPDLFELPVDGDGQRPDRSKATSAGISMRRRHGTTPASVSCRSPGCEGANTPACRSTNRCLSPVSWRFARHPRACDCAELPYGRSKGCISEPMRSATRG